jgi:hypothetical protein
MALPIIENPLYGLIQLETAAWSSPFTWVDRTADLAAGFNYSEGGRVGPPGNSSTDAGTLNATFSNLATVPLVGDLVRLRRYGTTEYAFTGYVQDVSQRIVFDQSVSLTTPVTLTTITCLDWVGYVSQFQSIGAGGLSATFAKEDNYTYPSRARSLNNSLDATNATQMIAVGTTTGLGATIGNTDMVATIADHLDLAATTQNLMWFGNHVLPTNKTTGRTGLVKIQRLSDATSSGKTFTDLVGSAGQLHYTEIDLESSSQNVANTIVANNSSVITTTSAAPLFQLATITQIGGGNRSNFSIVNGVEVVAVPYESTWSTSDATSITTYGNRATEINVNLAGIVEAANLASNPSLEYSDTGWGGGLNGVARRRKPIEDGSPFNAYTGQWSLRNKCTTATASLPTTFSGAESDGTPIIAGTTYYVSAYAARGTPSRVNMRAAIVIRWKDDSETTISSTTGANVSLTTANTWYQATASAAAPANATRATIQVTFTRNDGSNIPVNDFLWVDGLQFSTVNTGYFDGDTAPTTSNEYLWTGEVGLSPSFKMTNNIDDIIAIYLARYSTTSNRVTRIRWNAQEDLASVSSLTVGTTVSLIYKGTTTTYRIVGIDGNVDPERYMIDYYLEKV